MLGCRVASEPRNHSKREWLCVGRPQNSKRMVRAQTRVWQDVFPGKGGRADARGVPHLELPLMIVLLSAVAIAALHGDADSRCLKSSNMVTGFEGDPSFYKELGELGTRCCSDSRTTANDTRIGPTHSTIRMGVEMPDAGEGRGVCARTGKGQLNVCTEPK